VLGVNSPLRERYFWQVPGSKSTTTGRPKCGSNGDVNCDASFQRIYYANEPLSESGAITQSDCDEESYFYQHYVKDDGTALNTTRGAAEHLVCKENGRSYGAQKDVFWAGHIEQTGKEFTTEVSSGDVTNRGTETYECTVVYGGPSSTYAEYLAGKLNYADSSGASKAGKHCFKTSPCPASKRLVPFPTAYSQVSCSSNSCTQTAYDTSSDTHTEYFCELSSGNAGAHSSQTDAYGTGAAATAGYRG